MEDSTDKIISSGKSRTLLTAQFDPRLKTYTLLSTTFILGVTFIGIPLIPFWLVLGIFYVRRYFDALSCELTTRSLNFRKGVLFTTERTVPLDKIQDLSFKEGPILRSLGLSTLKIETAGQGGGNNGSEMSLTGIIDAHEFRQQVLSQRDRVTELYSERESSHTPTLNSSGELQPVLSEILDTLKSIDQKLTQ